jgi:hypothetical protein
MMNTIIGAEGLQNMVRAYVLDALHKETIYQLFGCRVVGEVNRNVMIGK